MLNYTAVFFCLLMASEAFSVTSVSQKIGVYQDNLGVDRQRFDVGLGLSIVGKGSVLNQTDINLTAGYNQSLEKPTEETEGDNKTDGQDVQLSLSQTWNKLTSTRLSVGRQNSQGNPANSYGVGASQWVFHEQVQLSLDAFKNNAMRDVIEVLGQDSEVISPPSHYHSQGTVLGVRHLASPKTILNYGYSYITSNDRPDLWSANFGVKRFVENPWSSKYHAAVHADIVRIDNTGEVGTETQIGELKGFIYQLSWLQSLGDVQRMKISYRQYREDEVTRVNEDKYFLGTDLVSAKYVVEFNEKTFSNISVPISLDTTYHRYLTNVINDEGDKIAAHIYEFGASTKF